MDLRDGQRRRRYRLASGLILLAGLVAAGWIHLAAGRAAPEGATAQMLSPEHSKKFIHDLQVYGGKANVLMYQFTAWLEGLFQGQNLAYTVAFLAALVALAVHFLGSLASEPPPAEEGQAGPGDWRP